MLQASGLGANTREDDDWNRGRDAGNDVTAGSTPKPHVDDGGAWCRLFEERDGARGAIGRDHVEVAEAEQMREWLAHVAFVLDDEHGPAGHARHIGRGRGNLSPL